MYNDKNTNMDNMERTFTQEEVNRIVSDRLSRDRDKRAAELDEREKAIKARELAIVAAEKLAAVGLPKELTSVLRYDDETSLDEAINRLSTIRGFKREETPSGGKKIYLEHKLPEASDFEIPVDPLNKAFRLPKK